MVLTSETLSSSTSLKSSNKVKSSPSTATTSATNSVNVRNSPLSNIWNQTEFIFDQEPFNYYPYENLPEIQTRTIDELEQKKKKKKKESFIVRYTFSFLAATCAELATYPLDLTKTRLQLQGEVAVSKFSGINENLRENKRGMLRTAFGIVKEEGLFKLWHGVTPAVYRHLIYSGTRMTVYEFLREDILGKREDGTIALWKAVLGGVFAGGLAQFLASPADLVKVQIQAEGRRKLLGMKPRVHGTWHAFTQIVSQGGIRGLWKGWVPNVQRAAFVNLGDLTTYDTAKRIILNHTKLNDNLVTHALSSTFSGLIAAALGTPADTIKTRIMNQPTNEKGVGLVYKGSIDCLLKCVKEEGFFSLYKGFIPCWLRMGPWSLTFWITYEKLRYYGGVRSF